MIDTSKIDSHVEKVIATQTVTKAHSLMSSKAGLWFIGLVSFLESSLPIPIITDPFMIAGILANRARTGWVVGVTLIGSVLGGVAAFIMARYFFALLESIMTNNMLAQFQSLISLDSSNTLLITLVGSITPIPYTITAWVVAVGEGSLVLFILASIIGRGIRYGVVGVCTYWFGPRAVRYAQRSLGITSIVLLLVAGTVLYFKL